jgi:hypothetical protein
MASYAVPGINNNYRDDLAFKVTAGANDDRSWTVTSSGVDVGFTANLGGSRYNVPDGTPFYFDPAIDGISTLVANGAFTGGANPSASVGLNDIQPYEVFSPPSDNTDLSRSNIRKFPAALLGWRTSEQADGAAVSQTTRGSRTGKGRVLYHEIFDLYLFVDRMDTDHLRRQDGMRILDAATKLLTDRREIDGVSMSAPGGVQIRRRFRHVFTDRAGSQRYYAYGLELAAMLSFCRTDSRTYNDLEIFILDGIIPQVPPLPDQGDFPIVQNMEVDNT